MIRLLGGLVLFTLQSIYAYVVNYSVKNDVHEI
jgi:hypothetical protein